MSPWFCRILYFNSSLHLHKFPIFPPISVLSFSTSAPKISIYDYLVNHHQFSPDSASKASASSDTNFLKEPKTADSVLSFLKETGLSKNQIEAVVQKVPWVLSSKFENTIKPKIKVFQDLGLKPTDFAQIIAASPSLLNCSADKLQLSVLILKNALGSYPDICRFLKNSWSGKVLSHDLNTTLMPNIDYLKSCGVCPVQIARSFCYYPLTFLVNQEHFKGFVQRVDEMGVDRGSNVFLEAFRVVSSMSRRNWELKLKLLRELGFSDKNIVFAFKKQPQAFAVSDAKIKEITELLLGVGGLDISSIVNHPELLTYSVEKRLMPRLRVLKALESKNLLEKRPGLVKFLNMSDAAFRKNYVNPYPDDGVGDLYVARQCS